MFTRRGVHTDNIMFEHLKALPQDPILGLLQLFRNDPRASKIDLGVGVYKDAQGHTPVMNAVKFRNSACWNWKIPKATSARPVPKALAAPWLSC